MNELDKHKKQWLQMPKILQKKLTLLNKPFLQEQKKIQEIFNKIKLTNDQFLDLSPYTEQIKQYKKTLKKSISPAFQELIESFDKIPVNIQNAILSLANKGWYLYIDPNMPPSRFQEIIQAIVDEEFTDDILIQYFEKQFKEIEESIITKFPDRKHIIVQALEAHIRGEYYLSIPVLLAQTDGICKDKTCQYFFISNNGKPEIATYVETTIATDAFKAALLNPFVQKMPINMNRNEREKDFNELNRHMVLHGESLDYGTKENSLKALSLINYVSQALK